jgi:GMP synthase-like glutamine amidotransferase
VILLKALVLQHAAHEGLGTIYSELVSRNIRADYIRLHMGHEVPGGLDGYSCLIIMGGPMGVYEEDKYPFITDELKLIECALKRDMPVLGICLGAQLMARAAGSVVYQGETKEIGWYALSLTGEGLKDPLLKGLPEELTVFQWHGDTFDVPAGAKLLASSLRFPNQLLRIGENGYAIQFHLEVMDIMVKEWIEINKAELDALKGLIDPRVIIRETRAHILPLRGYGEKVFSAFFNLIEI